MKQDDANCGESSGGLYGIQHVRVIGPFPVTANLLDLLQRSNEEMRATVIPDISVIIPHYNDLAGLDRCLAMLGAQSFSAERFEIVVADNNSPVGIGAVRQTVGERARIVEAPIQGAGPARNAAVAASRGRILAFIDSDCRPDPHWLECGIATLGEGDIIGGRVDIVALDPSNPNPIEAFEMTFAFPIRDYVERKSFAVTANMFVSRDIFDQVGPYRSTVAEDVDWCHRAVAMGYRLLYADKVAVAHPARADWPELARKWRRTTSETFALAIERPGGRWRWLAQCMLVLASIGPHAAKILTTRRLPNARARLGGLTTLFRIRWYRFVRGLELMASRD